MKAILALISQLFSTLGKRKTSAAGSTTQPLKTENHSTTGPKLQPTKSAVVGDGAAPIGTTTEPTEKQALERPAPKTLNEKQALFIEVLGEWLQWCKEQNIELIGGELYRPPEMAEIYAKRGSGIKNSNHIRKLAFDFIIFKDGKVSWAPMDYKKAGEKWQTLSIMARWGGGWGDYGHISFSHNGVK